MMKDGGMEKRSEGKDMMFGDDMTQAPVYHIAPMMCIAHACHAPVVHDFEAS